MNDKQQWSQFVDRLTHDNRGEGVRWHGTSHPVFEVQQKVTVVGLDTEYTDKYVLIDDEGNFVDPVEYFHDQADEDQAELNTLSVDDYDCSFLELRARDQMDVLAEVNSALTLTGARDEWKHVTSHLTKQGAQRFINRKGHDYSELKIYVTSACYSYELREVVAAILDGRVDWKEDKDPNLAAKFILFFLIGCLAALTVFILWGAL